MCPCDFRPIKCFQHAVIWLVDTPFLTNKLAELTIFRSRDSFKPNLSAGNVRSIAPSPTDLPSVFLHSKFQNVPVTSFRTRTLSTFWKNHFSQSEDRIHELTHFGKKPELSWPIVRVIRRPRFWVVNSISRLVLFSIQIWSFQGQMRSTSIKSYFDLISPGVNVKSKQFVLDWRLCLKWPSIFRAVHF